MLSSGKVAVIDDCDIGICSGYSWYSMRTHKSSQCFYVAASIGGKTIYIHTLIMSPPEGMVVDHISGDALDNRRSNLRICTQRQNCLNKKVRSDSKSGIIGVLKLPSGRFGAYINPGSGQLYLGTFNTINEAVFARNSAVSRFFGEFGRLSVLPTCLD